MAEQPELKVQAFLRAGNTLESLEEKYAVHFARHHQNPHIVSLHYDQLSSPMGNKIVQESRGVVLDESDNWRCLCLPYTKFFNAGESQARGALQKMNWKTARTLEKLDGSLMIMYPAAIQDSDGTLEWCVASSGRPDAAGRLRKDRAFGGLNVEEPSRADEVASGGDELETMADLFWHIFDQQGFKRPTESHGHYCFMFEMMSRNQVVNIVPDSDELVLHGARDLRTYEEALPEPLAAELGWKCVAQVGVPSSIEEVKSQALELDVSRSEGFVVVDHAFNRVKVKSPAYVALSLLSRRDTDSLNVRRMCSIVRANEGEEFCAYFPQWAELYRGVKDRFEECVQDISSMLEKCDRSSNKSFSQTLKAQSPTDLQSGTLWAVHLGKSGGIRQHLAMTDVKILERELTRGGKISHIRTSVLTRADESDANDRA